MSINELIWRREKSHRAQVSRIEESGQQITLTEEDAYLLPEDVQAIEVLAGKAWVSYNVTDMVVGQGGRMVFPPQRGSVIITALERQPVTLRLKPE